MLKQSQAKKVGKQMQGIKVKRKGSALVIHCQGQITFDNVGELKKIVEDAIVEQDYTALVLDLSEVAFIDSSGIGVLVALNSRVYSAGKRFYLLAPAQQAMKTLELVKLSDFFDYLDELEDIDLVVEQ